MWNPYLQNIIIPISFCLDKAFCFFCSQIEAVWHGLCIVIPDGSNEVATGEAEIKSEIYGSDAEYSIDSLLDACDRARGDLQMA
jgi:hypothetical protein